MLDSSFFPSIIYIWYEGGRHKPPLVRLTFDLTLPPRGPSGAARKVPRGGGQRGSSERARRPPRIGAWVARAKTHPDEGGDKASWRRRQPRARRRRRRRSASCFRSGKNEKGGDVAPFFVALRFASAAAPALRCWCQSVVPSQTRTRRITSHCSIASTTSMPEITRPNTV